MRALAILLLIGVTWTPKDDGGGGVTWTPKGHDRAEERGEAAPADPDEVQRLMLSSIEHTLWHEVGHLLVSELSLPVIGQEEDAADAFATLMMLTAEAPEDDRAERLLDVAEIWLVSHWRGEEQGEEPDYFDEHDLDAQRGMRVICFLAGEDPARARQLIEDGGLPEARAERCAADLEQAVTGWDALLAASCLAEGESAAPMAVRHHGGGGPYATILRETGLLEHVADFLAGNFRLQPGLVIEAASCGQANAFWSPGDRTVTLCYELLQDYEDLARRAIASRE